LRVQAAINWPSDVQTIHAQVSESSRKKVAEIPSILPVSVVRPHSALGIANAAGVPGTLGCLAHTLDDKQPVVLGAWHVLFGNGAVEGDAVWLIDESTGKRTYSALGRTLYGKIGAVYFAGEEYYVDCAVASCAQPAAASGDLLREKKATQHFVNGHDVAEPGSVVTKTGAVTGTTTGIVVDTRYSDRVGWRGCHAPEQILIRPANGNRVFSSNGDSGALILNASRKVVGLLWGTNCRGEGVACAIGPVLYAMNITL
jgi:hypothetical protein